MLKSIIMDQHVCHRGIWPSISNFKVKRSNYVIFSFFQK